MASDDQFHAPLGEPHRIDLPVGPIAYRERGQGPVVLFVHGLLTNALLWRRVLPPLAADHRVIAPDWPLGSHSVAMNPDADLSPPALAGMIEDFLRALDLEDVTIVANDTGGALTQILAASHPQRIGRLVLTPCDCFESFFPPVFRPLQWVARVPGIAGAIATVMRSHAVRGLPVGYGLLIKGALDHDTIDRWVAPLRADPAVRRDLVKVLRGVDSRHTLEAARGLQRFQAPVLLAWAAEDRVFPVRLAHRLAGVLPDSRVVTVADSYTFVPEDQPGWLVDQIRAFVGRAREGS